MVLSTNQVELIQSMMLRSCVIFSELRVLEHRSDMKLASANHPDGSGGLRKYTPSTEDVQLR